MATEISATQLQRRFSGVLGRVRFGGERFIVLKNGRPAAELRAPEGAVPVRLKDLKALLGSLPPLGPAEAEAFARDIEAGRKAALKGGPEDRWGS